MADITATAPILTPEIASASTKEPAFFRELARLYLSRRSNQFILAGNVEDAVPHPSRQNEYTPMVHMLAARFETSERVVLTYDISNGITFTDDLKKVQMREWYAASSDDPLADKAKLAARVRHFDQMILDSQFYCILALKFLAEMFGLANTNPVEKGLVLIVKHAELLLPNSQLSNMGDSDRQKLAILLEWLNGLQFVKSNSLVILLSSASSALHEDLRNLPHMITLKVPRPAAEDREKYLVHLKAAESVWKQRPISELVGLTAGMTLFDINGLILEAIHARRELETPAILQSLNRMLEAELGDKIEVVKPAHTMDDVVGASAFKAELERVRRLLEARIPEVAPAGILITGPNGVGKTFVIEAWSATCGRLVIVLKNLRGMYFGETDLTFEKLRSVLEVVGNVIILVDEADVVFGKPGRDTHETEARLFGHVIRMMSEPKNRGRIVWVLMTARPQRLAPDLKRSGRAGLKLAIFDPEGEDRMAYIEMVMKRAKVDWSAFTDEQRAIIREETRNLSPADFNEVLVDLRAERVLLGHDLNVEQVLNVVHGMIPSSISKQRRLQTLYAYLDCTRRSLVPPSLSQTSAEAAMLEIRQLEMELQE